MKAASRHTRRRATTRYLAVPCLVLGCSVLAVTPAPRYKPSAGSPEPLDITTSEYGHSRHAPNAIDIGDTAPDFSVASAAGGTVSLSTARAHGPVAIVFYRGHW